jgi:alkylation response protein AidB-like acyl-CoA dehydrogenase
MDEQQLIEARVKQLLAEFPPAGTDAVAFLGAQFDAGLAWVHFPEGSGGSGVPPKLQTYVQTELAAAGAPVAYMRNPIGYGMGAPTIVTHGSDAQQERYLRPLFTGEEVWCQLFSEPGACMSATKYVSPRCFGASGSVRASRRPRLARWPSEVHTF